LYNGASISGASEESDVEFRKSIFWLAMLITMTAVMLGCADNSQANSSNLIGIALTPTSPTITVGGTQTFDAMATYTNTTTTQDVTSTATWSSSVATVATVKVGVAKALGAGETTITVSFTQGTTTVDASTNLTVVAAQESNQEGNARVVFLSAPDVPESSLTMDGAVVGEVAHGSSFSIEATSGIHKFLSPDGRHSFLLNLRADTTYTFKLPGAGKLELSDSQN
jgi:hypothetical protein